MVYDGVLWFRVRGASPFGSDLQCAASLPSLGISRKDSFSARLSRSPQYNHCNARCLYNGHAYRPEVRASQNFGRFFHFLRVQRNIADEYHSAYTIIQRSLISFSCEGRRVSTNWASELTVNVDEPWQKSPQLHNWRAWSL